MPTMSRRAARARPRRLARSSSWRRPRRTPTSSPTPTRADDLVARRERLHELLLGHLGAAAHLLLLGALEELVARELGQVAVAVGADVSPGLDVVERALERL